MINAGKTLFVTHWPGGGVWGLKQLVQAAYIEDLTQTSMAEIADLHISSSIGSVAGNCLLIPDPTDPQKPKFKAAEIIEPFKKCASDLFGPDGIDEHYKHTTKHDLGNLISATPGFTKAVLARYLRDQSRPIHKPHNLLHNFLEGYLDDAKMSDLLKSSITYAHHMETSARICFAHLDTTQFDETKWNHAILPNHGSDKRIVDVIMASTAAPTVFNAHTIGDNHYVDLDVLYSPLVAIERALACRRPDNDAYRDQFSNPYLQGQSPNVNMIKISCGMREDQIWDAVQYATQGPLAMERDLISNMGIDQQRIDHETLKERFGEQNILCVGENVSELDKETEDLPSDSPFDGNYSNLEKIQDFALKHIKSRQDEVLRYVDNVFATRAQESAADPLAAFTHTANNNAPVPDNTVQTAEILPKKTQASAIASILSRIPRFGFRRSI